MRSLAARTRLPVPAEPGEVVAEARSVRVVIGGKSILDGVSFAVHAGEVLALVGPNGAGKSTALGVLAGDRKPAAGAVLIGGRPVGNWSTVDLARRRAVLPQHNPLSFPFDVAAVVRMGRVPWEGTDAEGADDAVIAESVRATDIGHLLGRRYPTLSGGEQSRVALARVFAQNTGLLMLDEPTASLDLRHQEEILRIARERASAGAAVLVVLHDLGLAAAYSDRIAVLDQGRLAAIGPPAEICTAELLSRVYEHPVEVIAHPRTGRPLILPTRD